MGTSVLIEIEVSDDESNNSLNNSFKNETEIFQKSRAVKKGNIESFFDIVMKEERQ
jgi:hypothetical protein